MTRADISLTVNDGDRIPNASNNLAANTSYNPPDADQKHQIEEDKLLLDDRASATQNSHATNNAAVGEALKAFDALLTSDPTKKPTSDVLEVAKKVIGALDIVKIVHPFIGVALLAFKGVIALEMKRRANDQRVSALFLAATDMMSQLLSLNYLRDPAQTIHADQPIYGQLQEILGTVLSTIEACGNAVDRYMSSGAISKFFRSTSWEETFIEFLDDFKSLKGKIKGALIIRSALRIENAITSIDHIEVKLDLILKMIRTPPKIDKDIKKEVAERNGAAAVLGSDVKIKEIADEIAKKDNTGTKRSKNESKIVEASLLHELHTPIKMQLEENKNLYKVSLKLATNEIESAIKQSESRILHAFNKGAHIRVRDPHLCYIWRVMKWSPSVRTGYFIPALHDYFSEHAGSTAKEQDTSNSAFSCHSIPPALRTAEDDDEPPPLSNEDEWCLKYLGVFYVPALKEAFDDDMNDLVSVREVNHFTLNEIMPENWSILKRLAYAAAGWHLELYRYAQTIQAIYNSMIHDANSVLPGNRNFVCSYLNSDAHTWVKQIARGVMKVNGSYEMNELVIQRSSSHEARIEKLLAQIHYNITSTESMPLYFDNHHVEHFLMPVIKVLLVRHGRLINLAKKVQLNRRELELCSTTLSVVLDFAWDRTTSLAESFRQQGLDVGTKFSTFSGGLYRIFFDDMLMPDEYEYWKSHQDTADEWDIDLDTLHDESDTRFGSPKLPEIDSNFQWQKVELTDVIDLSELSPIRRLQNVAKHIIRQIRRRRNSIKEYETIAVAAALDSLNWSRDGSKYLPEAGRATLDRLARIISAQDLEYCRAKGNIEMHKQFAVHQNSCDGCNRCPIMNARYDCLDCPQTDYQLCSDCVNLPTNQHRFPSSTHTLKHNMYLFRVEIPRNYSQHLRSDRDAIANAVPRHDVAIMPTGENCAECNKELPGDFFVCRCCPVSSHRILILCNDCAFQPNLAIACDRHSFTGHILVLVRNRDASYIHGKPEPQPKDKSEGEEPTIKSLQLEISELRKSIQELRTSRNDAENEGMTVFALAEQVKGLRGQMSTMLGLIRALHISQTARSALE